MNVKAKNVVLVVASLLSWQLAVIMFAQETASSPVPAGGASASLSGKFAAAESSQSPAGSGNGAWEILHSEGNATRFIGFRNLTW